MVDSSTIQLYSKRILKYVTRFADFVAARKAIADKFCNFKIGEINDGEIITLQGDNNNYISHLSVNGNNYLMLNRNNMDLNAMFYVEY